MVTVEIGIGVIGHPPIFGSVEVISKVVSEILKIGLFYVTPDWLRTFLAIYRSGSVTDGAQHRGLTQPAASQQLASLERALGGPFSCASPPAWSRRNEDVSSTPGWPSPSTGSSRCCAASMRVPRPRPEPPLRFGSSPEYFAAEVLPLLAGLDLSVAVSFGTDIELLALLERGEIDVVVTSSTPPRRSISSLSLGSKRFVLVCAPGMAPSSSFNSLPELATWLTGGSWVSYSLELPLTRRFWLTVLGRPFAARLQLVAPDLRAVLKAVELGLGVSLLPTFVCNEALADGRVVEVFPVSHLAPEEPWFACVRHGEVGRLAVKDFLDVLQLHAAAVRSESAVPS